MTDAKFKVFYHKHPSFDDREVIVRSNVLLGLSHTNIIDIKNAQDMCPFECNPCDCIFHGMQGEFASPSVFAALNKARENYGIKFHTSMSVGDCILDVEKDILYVCMNAGWKPAK